LAQSLEAGRVVIRSLRSEKVRSIAQQVGRAELGEDTAGVEYSEMEVSLPQLGAEDAKQVERRIRQTLQDQSLGYSFEVLSFLSERIKETLSGAPAAVAVKVYGDDLAAVDKAALQFARLLRSVPGTDNVRAEAQTGAPELVIRVRPKDVAAQGLRNAAILDA